MDDEFEGTNQDRESPNLKAPEKSSNSVTNDPSHELIASDRVEGTSVYRPKGDKIGKVHHFMVGKQSGKVEYAVLSFGGFLGLGEEFRPVPWGALDYSTELDGYVVSAEEDTLKNSPHYTVGLEPQWNRAYAINVYGYWGVPYI